MDYGLSDKVAIVTGGSSGIGLATARLLIQEGAQVAICARNPEQLALARQELQTVRADARLLALPCDVTNEPQVQNFVAQAAATFGGVDLLVNNAGRGRLTNFKETSDEAWQAEFNLKLFSIIYPVRAVYPLMQQRGGGRIVNINAVLSRQPEPHMVATSSARAAVLNLTKSLSNEFAADNILVNSINLGTIFSGQWKARYQQAASSQSEEEWLAQEAAKRHIPLGRFGQPTEVAAAILFLLSAGASYITGATLDVAGGTGRYS